MAIANMPRKERKPLSIAAQYCVHANVRDGSKADASEKGSIASERHPYQVDWTYQDDGGAGRIHYDAKPKGGRMFAAVNIHTASIQHTSFNAPHEQPEGECCKEASEEHESK
jgi:hypothetical protein